MQNTIMTVDIVIDRQDLINTKDVETISYCKHKFPLRKKKKKGNKNQKEAQNPAIKPSMCWISTLLGRQLKKNDCTSPRYYGS